MSVDMLSFDLKLSLKDVKNHFTLMKQKMKLVTDCRKNDEQYHNDSFEANLESIISATVQDC